MATMTINRAKIRTMPTVSKGKPGDIRLLSDVNANADRRAKLNRSPLSVGTLLGRLGVGESLFLEGYTANYNDADPKLKYMRTQGYTKNNSIVLTVRSTEEHGIKGVRVYREA